MNSFIISDKPKTSGGKIIIKNLKHSTVYEETVRQVEEQAKLKAEKYEEGELSDSTSEHQLSSSPSPEPSSGITSVYKLSETVSNIHLTFMDWYQSYFE